jgi:hypothetical protein
MIRDINKRILEIDISESGEYEEKIVDIKAKIARCEDISEVERLDIFYDDMMEQEFRDMCYI